MLALMLTEADLHPALWLVLGLFAVFSVAGPFRDGVWKRRAAAAAPDTTWREGFYREFHIIMWPLAGLCLLAWWLSGRTLQSFGFVFTGGWGGVGAWGAAILISGYMIYSAVQVARSEKLRADVRKQLESGGDYSLVTPDTPRQHRMFYPIAVAAGVTEEIIYRGFLIGVLALLMPLPAAAALALAVFIAAHAYQGWRGMARILPVSVILTLMFVFSGSLLPGILLHIIIDATGGAMMYSTAKPISGRGGEQPEGGPDR